MLVMMRILSLIFFCFAMLTVAVGQIKIGDQPTVQQKSVALDVQGSNSMQGLWLPRVSDTSVAGIRALNPPNGLVIYHTPSGNILLRANNAWVTYLTTAITSITTNSQTITGPGITMQTGTAAGTGNDFNIAANTATNTITYNLPDASTNVRGVVATGAQTFGGAKTFANGVTVNNGSTLNNGTTANGGLTVSGATGSTTNLTLGVTSATTGGAVTDKYLSVDAAGVITLNKISVITNNQLTIKSFTAELDGLPKNLNNNSVDRFTITVPGANFSTTSTVVITPATTLRLGTRIDFARVFDATTIEINMSTLSTSQPFTSGNSGVFHIMVTEF